MKVISTRPAAEVRDAAYAVKIQPGMRTELTEMLRDIWTDERINMVADLLLLIGDQLSDENVCEVGLSPDGDPANLTSIRMVPDFGHGVINDPRDDLWQAAVNLARSINDV